MFAVLRRIFGGFLPKGILDGCDTWLDTLLDRYIQSVLRGEWPVSKSTTGTTFDDVAHAYLERAENYYQVIDSYLFWQHRRRRPQTDGPYDRDVSDEIKVNIDQVLFQPFLLWGEISKRYAREPDADAALYFSCIQKLDDSAYRYHEVTKDYLDYGCGMRALAVRVHWHKRQWEL